MLMTDNVSNNYILALNLKYDIDWKLNIMYIPYLAHIIQLAIQSLLYNISSKVKNNNLNKQ